MVIHVAEPGDTVWRLAQRYGVSAQRILSDNGLRSAGSLTEGQALLILQPQVVHTVQPGETIASIAERYSLSQIELIQNNPVLADAPFLRAGEQLVIAYQAEKGRELTISGYAYPHINRSVLRRALPYLTYLTIFGYGFTVEGELIDTPDEELIALARQFAAAPVMLLSSITENGNFDSERASLLFHSKELQDQVLGRILGVMDAKGYVGLDIDFEFIRAEDEEAYLAFLQNAANQLHEAGYFLHVDLAPKTSAEQSGLLYEAHNYQEIGRIADSVLLMTYEWGYTYGPPMAVAPLNQVERVVSYAVTEIDPDKILMGIPNYGYDWPLPFESGVTRAVTIGNQQAVEIAIQNGSPIAYDEAAQSPYFSYQTEAGTEHVVWFEDVRSIQAKLSLLDTYALQGAGYWNVMRPFAQNFAYLSASHAIRKIS